MTNLFLSLFVMTAAAAGPPQPPGPIYPEDVASQSTPGSLYDEQASREVTGVDLNTWRRGDIVRVIVVENTNTDLASDTQTGVQSTNSAEISALFGADIPQLGGIGVDVSPTLGVSGGRDRRFQGDGRVTSDANVQTSVACQVIEVLPGGNLRIWGWKETRVNRETQYVTLEGIIRPKDVSMDGAVRSDQVAQAFVEVTGRGVVADTQGPGLGTRIVDRVWPF
jgi:flagellar L-ring protein precursor FlgH